MNPRQILALGRGRHTRLGLLVALAPACAGSTPQLEPVDAKRGRIGTHYEIEVDDRNWGDIRVWSSGTQPLETNGQEPSAQFSLRIRNDSDETIRLDLDRAELEVATEDHRLRLVDAPVRFEGAPEIPPRSTGRVGLDFRLPVDPEDIEGVELSWVVSTPGGPYSQSTPFVPDVKNLGDGPAVIYATTGPWDPYGPWRRSPYRWWGGW